MSCALAVLLKTVIPMVHFCPPNSVVMGNVIDIGESALRVLTAGRYPV
jgi:hypothetical protein